VNEFYYFFGAVTSLFYSIWCSQRIRDFDLGAVNEVLDFLGVLQLNLLIENSAVVEWKYHYLVLL
jgi:hypothetical protein